MRLYKSSVLLLRKIQIEVTVASRVVGNKFGPTIARGIIRDLLSGQHNIERLKNV